MKMNLEPFRYLVKKLKANLISVDSIDDPITLNVFLDQFLKHQLLNPFLGQVNKTFNELVAHVLLEDKLMAKLIQPSCDSEVIERLVMLTQNSIHTYNVTESNENDLFRDPEFSICISGHEAKYSQKKGWLGSPSVDVLSIKANHAGLGIDLIFKADKKDKFLAWAEAIREAKEDGNEMINQIESLKDELDYQEEKRQFFSKSKNDLKVPKVVVEDSETWEQLE